MGVSQASQGSRGAGSWRAGRELGWDLCLPRAAVSMMSERRNSASQPRSPQPSPQCFPALDAAPNNKGESARLTHRAETGQKPRTAFALPGASGLVTTWPELNSWPQACLSFFLTGLRSPGEPHRTGMRKASNSRKVFCGPLKAPALTVSVLREYVWQL